LACGSFPYEPDDGKLFATVTECPASDPHVGEDLNDRHWFVMKIDQNHVFNFKDASRGFEGQKDDAYALLSIWIKLPETFNGQSLANAGFSMQLWYDDYANLWLDGDKLGPYRTAYVEESKPAVVDLSMMHAGWNHLLMQIVQTRGGWNAGCRFISTDPAFLTAVEFAVEKPNP
jgi:hypothetical protein